MASISAFKVSVVFVNLKACVLLFVLISSLMYSVDGSDNSCGPCLYNAPNHICCNGECVLGSNCVDHSCLSSSDCSGDESCCGGTCKADRHCLGDSCKTNSDCGGSGSCCRTGILLKDRKCRANCIGAQCSRDSDCGRNEQCRGNRCEACHTCCPTCWSCDTDSDCKNTFMYDRCCHGTCQKGDDVCIDQTAAFCGAIGSIGLLCLVGLLCKCVCYRRAFAEQKSLPPYPGRNVPPPEYEEQARTVLQSYVPETRRARERPPPYTAEPECTSGGIHVSYSSYGAVALTAV